MWILFQQPDEFLDQFDAERDRRERIALLMRALRGAAPPFDQPGRVRLQQAMAEQPNARRLATEAS